MNRQLFRTCVGILTGVLTAAACTDGSPLVVQAGTGPLKGTDIALETLDVQACQYGGTYQFCKLPPPPESGTGTDPSTPAPESSGSGSSTPQPAAPDTATTDTACTTTNDPVLNSGRVQVGFSVLWEGSNYSPSIPQDQRREQYAWIVRSSSGEYSLVPMNVQAGSCGFLSEVYVVAPPGTVGFVHTHPWAFGEVQTVCGRTAPYLGLPSQEDLDASEALGNMTGYILDASGITRFSAASGQGTEARHTRCGY